MAEGYVVLFVAWTEREKRIRIISVSKTTTSGRTASLPRSMTAEAMERAARADRDTQLLTETDLKRMKRTPQAKIIRRALELRSTTNRPCLPET